MQQQHQSYLRRGVITAAVLMAAASMPLSAQQNTMDPVPKDYQDFFGLGTKQLKVWGGLDVLETFDSNILLSSSKEDSDTVTSLNPSLHLRFDHTDESVQLDYLGRDRFYSDHNEFNGMEHYFDAMAHLQAGKFSVEPFTHVKNRAEPFDVLQVTDRLDSLQIDTGLLAILDFDRLDVELTGMKRRFHIFDSVMDMFDHDRTEISAMVAFDIMPKTQGLVEYGQSRTVYDENNRLNDWTSMHFVAGFRTSPSGKVRAVVKVGVVQINSESGAAIPSDDATEAYLSAAVDWDATAEGTFKFSALRQPVESIFSGVSISTRFSASYYHQFTEKLGGSAGLTWDSAAEVSGGISNRNYYDVNVQAKYLPAKHFSLTAMIEYRMKVSGTSAFEFNDFRGTIGAGVDF